MKLISVDIARTTWLFPLTELNPKGLSFTKAFLALAERYDFKKFPKHSLDFDPEAKGLVFNEGTFKTREGREIIVKLTIFTDGILADSWSSTNDSEDFLRDGMEWLKKEHGFFIPADRKVKTLYLSQLTVTTDKKIAGLNPKLQEFADLVASTVGDRWEDNSGFNVGAVNFWPNDPTKPSSPAQFRFEIKANTPAAEKRYFAIGPVQTDVHLQLLEKLESLFG
jgi:hypothetical protein